MLESFRPACWTASASATRRCGRSTPRSSTARSPATGRTARSATAPGHDMNYLGLVGLLGLTGEAGGPPVQAAGQIADLGGGALMAAFGDPRRAARARPLGRGPARRRLDGRRRAVVAGDGRGAPARRRRRSRRRGDLELAGALLCYRPYACADGWVTLGALEPKFWQAWCRGVGREDLIEHQFDRPGSRRRMREVEAIFAARTREEWRAFASEHDCCLEPVLASTRRSGSELVRAREMVVELDQPGARAAGAAARRPGQAGRTPGDPNRAPGPALGEHTRRRACGARLWRGGDRRDVRLRGRGVNEAGLLKMSELASRSGVSAGTIKHYLREGLLGEGDDIVRTSRNMAYYPPEYRGAHQAHQAPAGRPLHAAAGHPGSHRRARGRARVSASGSRPPKIRRGATTSRATCSTGWPSSGCSRRRRSATTPTM